MIQNRVVAELNRELELSREPGYKSRYDDDYEVEFPSRDSKRQDSKRQDSKRQDRNRHPKSGPHTSKPARDNVKANTDKTG